MRLVRLEQGTPAWKAWRYGGIGGSDAAAILGLSPYSTREELLVEKATRLERESTFAMRRGNRLEPVARSLYCRNERCRAEPVCVEHDDATWMRVSLDGLCEAPERDRWVIEIKCPSWQAHDIALAGLVPVHYQPQCQWQLLVTGLDRLDYVSFNDGVRFDLRDRLAVVPVAPDAEMQGRLLEECERFWQEVLTARAGSRLAGVA